MLASRWTKESLREVLRRRLDDYQLIVVSNKQPYSHHFRDGQVIRQPAVSGVVTALQSVIQACGGLWVAHGDGPADRKVCNNRGLVRIPGEYPQYDLKRVFLTKDEFAGYYYGFANDALWPLSHVAFVRPTFRGEDWELYKQVNRKFADAILEDAHKRAFVWIQDYHLALVPGYLKEQRPDLIIGQFWHIPWPNPEIFRICPSKTEILTGLLGNDLLGFHLRYHADNFLRTCDREIESRHDQDRTFVERSGSKTRVQAFPISIDFDATSRDAGSDEVARSLETIRKEWSLEGKCVIAGLDRIDYTKGIPERLLAISRFLDKYPDYRERFVFIQVGSASRTHIPKYKVINDEIDGLVKEINWRYSTDSWSPIVFVRRALSYPEVLALYRLTDVCIVSSLDDGMNLVAKEYVTARSDLKGVLLLSSFTGAARELTDAIIINPFDRDNFADSIRLAVEMDAEEQAMRLSRMREQISENNVYNWAANFIMELTKL